MAVACEELFATEGEGAPRPPTATWWWSATSRPIKAAVAWALGADAGLSWRLHLQTASVTRIGWGNGGPVLESFNELAPGRYGTSQSRRA